MAATACKTQPNRAARVNLLALGRQLSNYVESHCNGSVETLLSSGFDAQRAASSPQMPGTPSNPRLEQGNESGKLVLGYDSDGTGNTRNFSVQYAEDLAGPWIDHGIFTATKVPIPGLTPGKVYFGRAKAHGAAGSSDWSTPTSKMVI